MDIKKEDLPVMLQAFDLEDGTEIFVAEQLVSSQADVDKFTVLYAGKIIKASKEIVNAKHPSAVVTAKKRNPATGLVMIAIILIVLALVIYGFATGWIQQKFNLNI